MGRTVTPYSIRISMMKVEHEDFRRGLPKPKKEFFDEIFRMAKRNLASGVMASDANSMHCIFLSALVEILSENKSMKSDIEKLRSEIDALKNGNV